MSGNYGALHVNATTGAYIYILDPTAPLESGTSLTETFSYLVSDATGSNASTLTIGISGTGTAIFNDVANPVGGDTVVDDGTLSSAAAGAWTSQLATAISADGAESQLERLEVSPIDGATTTVTIEIQPPAAASDPNALDLTALLSDAGGPELDLGQVLDARFAQSVADAAREVGETLGETLPAAIPSQAPSSEIATGFAFQTLDALLEQAPSPATATF